MQIPLNKITIHDADNRRQVRESVVAELAASIAEIGLLQPIVVAQEGEGYRLIAGRHRLEAHLQIKAKTILANVVDLDERRQRLAYLVENLQRSDLTAQERAEQTAEVAEIYEALHPTKTREQVAAEGGKARSEALRNCASPDDRGKHKRPKSLKPHNGNPDRETPDPPTPPKAKKSASTVQAAKATGQAASTVERHRKIVESLPDSIRDRTRALDLPLKQLEALAQVDPADRVAVVQEMEGGCRRVDDALAKLAPPEPEPESSPGVHDAAFAMAPELEALAREIEALRRKVKARCNKLGRLYWNRPDAPRIAAAQAGEWSLENHATKPAWEMGRALEALKGITPHAICSRCKGDGEPHDDVSERKGHCLPCGGIGWISVAKQEMESRQRRATG